MTIRAITRRHATRDAHAANAPEPVDHTAKTRAAGSHSCHDDDVPAWLVWLIAAGVLAGAETLSLDLVLIMCAGGAAAGALAAGVGAPPAIQVIVAIAVAIGLLAFVRPVARRHLTGVGTHPMGTAALVGKSAIVLSKVDTNTGLIRLNGQEWTARAYDATQTVPAGETVQVVEISGATALVWRPQ